ncbi:MAG: MarR family transcriptional regulator [Enterococcus lacertideformus]|uniref:MarR family transcriptional regulator n=1 Tax=Enterococcus lacertideformus TaxID=2771493 RepID=A0A931AVL9_9ENTE|nr:MarR family transcriptional regulator [Enterococcus lacertideformus]
MDGIVRDIGTISRALDSISNIEFKEVDLTRGQYLYLVRICEHPGIIQEKLAEMIKVDRTTTARAVKKLEIKGLIRSTTDPHNKKIKKLYATDEGSAIYPFIIREHHYSNQMAIKGLSKEEINQLQKILKKVRKNVSEDWNFVKKWHKRNY